MKTTEDDQHMKSFFRHDFRLWLAERPEATLGDLREWLEEVHDQCLEFVWDDDPPIEETDDIPHELDEYLSYWDDHDGECFSYREANVEEDIMNVDEYIEELGSETKLNSFPVYKVA